jgi:hypothetical protein
MIAPSGVEMHPAPNTEQALNASTTIAQVLEIFVFVRSEQGKSVNFH